MMTKPFWISLGGSVLAATLVLGVQSMRNHQLRQHRATAAAEVDRLERAVPPTETGEGGEESPGDGRSPSRSRPIQRARPAPSESAERIAQASGEIGRLTAGLDRLQGSPAGLFQILPDVLRLVQDLTLEELIAVAEGIGGDESPVSSSGAGVIRSILYVLAAEQDPHGIVRNREVMRDRTIRESILGALARRDPGAAGHWLLNSDLAEVEKREMAGRLAMQAMRRDVDAGLSLLRLAGNGGGGFSTASGPLPDEMLPDLVAALGKPENADLRSRLRGLIVRSAVDLAGIDGARRRIEELDMPHEDLSAAFDDVLIRSLDAEPAELIAWMRDVQTPEQHREALPLVVRRWAERDYNAAGEWLGTMAPSPERDAAIGQFSQTVAEIDPRAAIVWAGEIESDLQRSRAIVKSAERWLVKDPAGAAQWLDEAGIDLEAVRE